MKFFKGKMLLRWHEYKLILSNYINIKSNKTGNFIASFDRTGAAELPMVFIV